MGIWQKILGLINPPKTPEQIKYEGELMAKTNAAYRESFIKEAERQAKINGKLKAQAKYGKPKPVQQSFNLPMNNQPNQSTKITPEFWSQMEKL